MKSALPKVVHRLGGQPLIAYPLAILRRMEIEPIIVVVGFGANEVTRLCAAQDIQFVYQAEQRGTGHATLMAHPPLRRFRGDVLIVNGDLPLLREQSFRVLLDNHRNADAAVSLLTAEVGVSHGLGRIVRDRDGHVLRIVEERDASEAERNIGEINVGLYCADAAYLFTALEQLKPANAQKELYLTDVVELAGRAGRTIATAAANPIEGTQISCRADLAEVEKMQRNEINRKWMDSGVTLEDPATAYIGPDVIIGQDTVIGPNVTLRGSTRIGKKCRIDGSVFISDTTIGDRVWIKFSVVITESVVEDDVQIGPFAQLRPETRLGRGVHIGNFVETKKAVIGAGTKANHLAYLGDTEIGEGANIGAGTITCNYDGFRKHRTVIGDRVQVGSDSQLVAPVNVGDDAYIATGTTVRQDVPAGTLCFNPREQAHRQGWVAARRQRESAQEAVGGKKKSSSGRSSTKRSPRRPAGN
jgi:bifunctional UDP-N-acetylglucosamine pyrophosphorylase/glucosamine-1-phosphate N-acetyltransferase